MIVFVGTFFINFVGCFKFVNVFTFGTFVSKCMLMGIVDVTLLNC